MSDPKNPFSVEELGAFLQVTPEDLKSEAFVKQKGSVYFMVLNRKVNSFTTKFLREINKCLDQVESAHGETALVTVGFNQKFFSTGLDLGFMMGNESVDITNFLLEYTRTLGRIQAFPLPTIAMLNGHTIAGGCMFAFAHDYTIMRDDFGIIQMNEVELGAPLPAGMMSTLKYKLGHQPKAFKEMILEARKFSPKEAFQLGWVDQLANPKELLKETFKRAEQLSKFGSNKLNYKALKEELNKDSINDCFNRQYSWGVRGEPVTPAKIGAKL